jgi:hypothetical protein
MFKTLGGGGLAALTGVAGAIGAAGSCWDVSQNNKLASARRTTVPTIIGVFTIRASPAAAVDYGHEGPFGKRVGEQHGQRPRR